MTLSLSLTVFVDLVAAVAIGLIAASARPRHDASDYCSSKRSRVITLVHALTNSRTKSSCASSDA